MLKKIPSIYNRLDLKVLKNDKTNIRYFSSISIFFTKTLGATRLNGIKYLSMQKSSLLKKNRM